MDRSTRDTPPQTTPDRPRRRWPIVSVAILVVAGIAVGIWAINQTDATDDQAVATELADTWLRGWEENDAEVVRSVFTDNAIYSDVGFSGGRTKTVEETVGEVETRGPGLTNVSRIGELTPIDPGTFTFVVEFDGHGERYSGEVEIELHDDLASRIEWLTLDVIDS